MSWTGFAPLLNPHVPVVSEHSRWEAREEVFEEVTLMLGSGDK